MDSLYLCLYPFAFEKIVDLSIHCYYFSLYLFFMFYIICLIIIILHLVLCHHNVMDIKGQARCCLHISVCMYFDLPWEKRVKNCSSIIYCPTTKIIIHNSSCCVSSSFRVRIYILDDENGENYSPRYLKINPRGELPTLEIDDRFVSGSDEILRW